MSQAEDQLVARIVLESARATEAQVDECRRLQASGCAGFDGTVTEAVADAFDRLRGAALIDVLAARGYLDPAARAGVERALTTARTVATPPDHLAATHVEGAGGSSTAETLLAPRRPPLAPPMPAPLDARVLANAGRLVEAGPFATLAPAESSPGDAPPAPASARRIGKYEIVRELGRGGMGVVYQGRHAELGHPVAIKVLLAGGDASPELVERFEREARACARLKHAGIVAVHDIGREDGKTYIVMELVEGTSLDALLDDPLRHGVVPARVAGTANAAAPSAGAAGAPRRRAGINAAAAVQMVADIAEALEAAHAAGVIHRDLKPINVLRESRTGRMKVMDFGLARIADDAGSGATAEGSVMGTLAYMSPEQAGGEVHQVDARSDVYQIGAILYELLTGRPPYVGDTRVQLHLAVLTSAPESPRLVNPAIDRDAETICLRAMERDKARRYASARELAEDCRRYLTGEPIHARPAGLARRAWLRVKRHKTLAIASAALALVLAGMLATWYFTPGTVTFRVTPPGARVRIGGHEWAAAEPREIALRAGGYELEIQAADHDPHRADLLVRRGHSREVKIDLPHHAGTLEAECFPPGSELAVDGTAYGSRIRNLPLPTGSHVVRASSPGHFVEERAIAIDRDAVRREAFSLESGRIWIHSSAGVVAGHRNLLPDLDGDGSPEVLIHDLTIAAVHSGRDGRRLGGFEREVDGAGHVFGPFRLGAGLAPVLAYGFEGPNGMRVETHSLQPGGAVALLWRWQSPPRQGAPAVYGRPVTTLADVTGDGVDEIAATGAGPWLWILDGREGKELRRIELPGEPGLLERGDGDGVLFHEKGKLAEDQPVIVGLALGREGRVAWHRLEAAGRHTQPVKHLGVAESAIAVMSHDGWVLLDAATGRELGKGSLPVARGGVYNLTRCDLDGDGAGELLCGSADGGLHAVRPADGSIAWSAPAEVRGQGSLAPVLAGPGGPLVCNTVDGIVALDPVSGNRLWSAPGAGRGVAAADWDGDGEAEIFALAAGSGVVCLRRDGRERWRLLPADEGEVGGISTIPDCDGDGLGDLLLERSGNSISMMRGPRLLWTRRAARPLQATPLIADADDDGTLEVFQVGEWGATAYLACLEGRSGLARWTFAERTTANRPPAPCDWDGDGALDLAMVAVAVHSGYEWPILRALRARDGASLATIACDLPTEVYATPAIADLDGDGAMDAAFPTWRKGVLAFSGRAGALLWRHETGAPNMGAAAAADLNRDGRADGIAASMDGRLYALNGPDGAPLWSADIRPGTRAIPRLFDLDGEGTADVLITTAAGVLRIFDGRNGTPMGALEGGTEVFGAPALTRLGDALVIVAPRGRGGVAAVDWGARKVLWQFTGHPVLNSPVVADLDRDGRAEVVVAAADGELVVLDLGSGARIWGFRLCEAQIEADPAVGDLDGDGLLEIVVADHSGLLTAVRGFCTPAGRARQR